MCATRLIRWSLAVVVTLPTALVAQVVVRVTDRSSRPVPAAVVELWSASERVATRTTDSDGLARFVAGERTRSRSALVRRLGFRPGQLRQEVSSRYQSPSTQGRKANVEGRRATVTEDEVGTLGTGTPTTGWRAYTRFGMAGARAEIAQRGHVRPLAGTHTFNDFGIWRYPPLHAELAGHFVDPLFGETHTMTLSRTGSRQVVLRFCARDRRRSGLDGVMRIDGSGGVVDARWTYWNPSRDAEQAGGEVLFAPLADSGPAPLFSASGLFWRRLPSKRYLQSWQDYSAWELLPDSVGTSGTSPSWPIGFNPAPAADDFLQSRSIRTAFRAPTTSR